MRLFAPLLVILCYILIGILGILASLPFFLMAQLDHFMDRLIDRYGE